jgi:hypothetical protein
MLEHGIPTSLSKHWPISAIETQWAGEVLAYFTIFLFPDTKFSLVILIKELMVSDFCG